MKIRNVQETDYDDVIERLNEWWRGRNMADMLPRLFFIHFQDTSFVCLKGDRIIGFIFNFQKVSVFPAQNGFIAVLKKVPASTVSFVEIAGMSGWQSPHNNCRRHLPGSH